MKPALPLLLILSAAACQSAPARRPPPPPNSNRVIFGPTTVTPKTRAASEAIPDFKAYIPRAPGQKRAWTIEYRRGQDLLLRGRREQELIGRRAIDGREYLVSRWTLTLDDPRQQPRSGELLERLTDDGLFERVGDEDQRRLAFPLAVGASWFETGDEWAISYVVEGLETIEVAGETYQSCLKIRGLLTHEKAENNQVIETYYARDIGRVYQVIYEPNDRRRILALIPERS